MPTPFRCVGIAQLSIDALKSSACTSGSGTTWRIVAIVAVLPAVVHLPVLVVALIGITGPAIWIFTHLLSGPWSVPLLWMFVIGGPLLSVIAGLILELWQGSGRSVMRTFSMFAGALLILGLVTTLPLPWILVFE